MVDLGHDRGWLNADAAASLWRVDAQIGHPLQVTDAGRTGEQQAHLRWLYENGQGSFAAKPGESPHEAGNAIDTNERLVDILHDHGWRRPLAFEPWHFVYWPNYDNHINESAEDDMTPDQAADLAAVKSALFYGGNWQNKDGSNQVSNYGVLPIVIHNQTLIAKQSGELAAIKAAVSQLSVGSGVTLDMKAIEDAAERGARDALSGLTLKAV